MGRKLTVYMLEGTPTGPKTVEIGNWSGKAFYVPRAFLKGLLSRSEFSSQGIYLLQSQSEDDQYDASVYIGEAEELASRLKQHIADRDFEAVVCFSSKDDSLTKAHIKYLEARFIQLAKEANTSRVENSNSPKGAKLSEADTSDMEYFLDQIKLILPVVGVNALVSAAPHSSTPLKQVAGQREFKVKSTTLIATMVEVDGAFVVRAGSQANRSTSNSIAPGWLNIRKKLIEAGVLKLQGNNFIFTEDANFSSPSAASSVVLGRQAPGPVSWISDDGKTYKEHQAGSD